MAGAFLLAVLAAVMPGSDGVALAQTPPANVALVTSAGNAPIPLNGLYDSGVTLVNAIDGAVTVIAISDYKPLKIGLTVEVNSELMTITDLTPGAPHTMTVQTRPSGVSHAANTHVWANAAPVEISASAIADRDTGANLAANVDAEKFANSGATLTQPIIDTIVTSLTVSDLHPLFAGRTVKLDTEQMYVSSLDPGFWGITGATLTGCAANDPVHPVPACVNYATIPINNQSKLGVGWILQVDSEKMLISTLYDGSPDTMTVQRGYGGSTITSHSSGAIIFRVRTLLATDVGIYQTVIPITDQSKLKVGWIARVDFERMLITGLTDGSPDTMTVQRGYDGDSAIEHISGSRIFASGATLEGAVDQTQTEIFISDKDLLTFHGIARVDLELMYITALTEGSPDRMTVQRGYGSSTATTHSDGAAVSAESDSTADLAGAVNDTQTVIPITNKDLLAAGSTVRVGLELMYITALGEGSPDTMTVSRGYLGSTAVAHNSGDPVFAPPASGATLQSAVQIYQTVVPISDKDLLQDGWTVRVEGERMLITARQEGSPDTMTVTRGYDNTPVSAHGSGESVYSGPDKITVQRGYGGTTKATHNAGILIYIDLRTLTVDTRAPLGEDSVIKVGNEFMSIVELPEAENTIKVSRGERGSTAASHYTGDHIFDADGLGGYSFTVTTDSVSAYLQPVYARDGDLQGNTFVGSIEIGAECDNAVDDDGDWKVNEGCPTDAAPETGTQCSNAVDDDGDAKINDGCPAVGAAETLCADAIDNDSDGKINDGCPAFGLPETGTKCNNAIDDDGDGKINDGCPGRSLFAPTLTVTDDSLDFSQTTTGTEPGSTGSGTLAIFTLWAKQFTATPLNLCALASATLSDVSADFIPSALQSCQVNIVKCPDVSVPAGGDVNMVDVLWEARAIFYPETYPREPKHDINNNGIYNTVDVLITAQLALLGPELHCPPP
jgi:hypothetical protein